MHVDVSPSNSTRVLFLAAEADPFIKVGGLGDVAGSLPRALRASQSLLDVRLVLPFHSAINRAAFAARSLGQFSVPHPTGALTAEAFELDVNGVPVYLIAGDLIPESAPVYSSNMAMDGPKYTFFSVASLELARHLNWQPDILHANDWHTALAVYQLSRLREVDPFFAQTRSVLSVHNLPFMGAGAEVSVHNFGIPFSLDKHMPEWARGFPLPLGLLTADRIVAVSPGYAQEILTPDFGCGLQNLLSTRSAALTGILNGIDTQLWNPITDPLLTTPYQSGQWNLRGENKAALQTAYHLPVDPDIPLIICIGRMDPQKGVDLALDGLRLAAGKKWQAIILGTGIPELEADARRLATDFPARVRTELRFDSRLSHQLYAGGDILLMPSRYEPCGLAQMIAMRYGCVPLARSTGGLRDTIRDADINPDGNGFLFSESTPQALEKRLSDVLTQFAIKEKWHQLQQCGMEENFSWDQSAVQYVRLYQELMEGSL